MIEYMGTGYGSTRFALITEQANATWKLKSFKIEEKRFTPKTSCGQHIPIDKDYNSNTTPLFTASTASTTVSVPATPTPKRVVITGSIAAGAAPAQFGASLSFSTTVGKVYTIYLENVSLETTNLAPSYQNYTGYAVVNNPADAGDAGKMLANGSLGYTNCYKGYAITFVARATTTWLVLGGMVAAQDAGQAASVSVLLQKLRIVGSQPIRRTVQLLADKRYRFGFNGKENDNEIKGQGNQQDYGMRIYDSRLGRFLSTDPITKYYPELTPYQFSSNNPIWNIDLDGLEGVKITDVEKKTIIVVVDILYVLKETKKQTGSNLSQKQIDKIQKQINKELNRKSFKDNNTGYAVTFQVNFIKKESMQEVNKELAGNNDVQNPGMFIRLKNAESKAIVDASGNEYTSTKEGGSVWRILNITDPSNGHTIVHEIFHNLTHNHKNSPLDIKNQIDPNNQKEGHQKAGGVFQYEDARDGTTIENVNQKNIQDVLRSLPEKKVETKKE